ncbi:MAG: hypothetical protein WA919_10300 [Coleofasciculaceae cyanobacterium]
MTLGSISDRYIPKQQSIIQKKSSDPLPMRFNGRFLIRSDRLKTEPIWDLVEC